ncbi:MAG: choice-of-anchor M domain-containing protein [Verrucomicrobiales bacterium]|nr:choice-of-anchor M domain-containing protein [Verrucomicrobiales bacterium]
MTEHCDFLIVYQPQETNQLSIVLRDEDHGINYRTNEVILVAAESSRITLPAGTPFGNEDDPVWVLPQSQDPNLLYRGFSAERIPFGVFARPFNFRLTRVEGPGYFFAWQAAEFGALNVKMNTLDGIDDADKTTPIIGSHEHFNWGFTTTGVYRVTFQVDGQRVGESTNIVSEPTPFIFHVLPLPAEPPSPPRLAAPAMMPPGDFAFDLIGVVGSSYRIESTEDFQNWMEVKTITLDASPARVTLPSPLPRLRFYRARQL